MSSSSSSCPSTRASTGAPGSCASRPTASTRCASRSSATRRAPRSPRWPARLTLPLQHDDRDLALGLALVLVIGRPLGRHRLPHLGLLVRRGLAGAGLEALVLDLHLDLGVGLEVQIPGGRLVGSAL